MPVHNSQDPFWDVREQERQEEAALRNHIDQLERSINLGKRALAIKNAPGYQDFLQAIQDVRQGHLNALASTSSQKTNEELRELRGRCHAIADILAILAKTEMAVEQLAAMASARQNELEEHRRRRPRSPKQKETS